MNEALSSGTSTSSPTGLESAAPSWPTWSRRASLRVSIAVVAHTLWTSASPTMMYRLYAQQWHLTHTQTTAIFAIYPLVVVVTLAIFGNISDHIGRRTAMLFGVGASLIGSVLFAVAPSLGWVFVGRAFMGAGVGLAAGPASAAVLEFSSAAKAPHAAAVTSTAQSAGFVAAVVLGGALVQYAPWPTHSAFALLAPLLASLWICTWFLPRSQSQPAARWRPTQMAVAQELRQPLLVAAAAAMAAFMHGALVLSVGGQVAFELVHSSNVLANSAVVAVFAGVSGLVAIAGRNVASQKAIVMGGAASAAGAACFAFAAAFCNFSLFLFAAFCSGVGYSFMFVGGLALVQHVAPAAKRAGMISILYLLAYVAQAGAAFALGAGASAVGLKLAVYGGAAFIAISSLSAALLAVLRRSDLN